MNRLFMAILLTCTAMCAGSVPVLTSISQIAPQQTQSLAIAGSGFGTHAAYTGDSSFISITDTTGTQWQAGYNGDFVTLSVSSWTDSRVVLAGFTGQYGSNGWTINTGDKLRFQVWNAQTGAASGVCTVTVGQSTAQSCQPPAGIPVTANEWEGHPGAWTWNTDHFEGYWSESAGPATATLAIQSFKPQSVVINRTDTPGSVSYGLTAVYTGQISSAGNSIVNGSVTWTWPGHSGYPSNGTWTANWGPAYSAVGDFSLAGNPSGPWSYLTSGSLLPAPSVGTGGNSGLLFWSNSGGLSDWDAIVANISGQIVNVSGVAMTPDHLDMSPNVGNVAARFTVPSAGTWSVSGDFSGIEASTTQSHGVAIFVNGSSAFSASISSAGQIDPFNLNVVLKAGDLIDFITYAGSTVYWDNTGLAARIVPLSGQPAVSSGGVVPVYSSSTTVTAGEWVSIYGTNLASGTAVWNGEFPKSLGGVTVTVDGRPASLWFVSPGQINLQVPDDTVTGPVQVVVTNAGAVSMATVTLGQFSPAFSLLDGTHVAGIILRSDGSGTYGAGSYDIIGPTGTSLGYATVAAKAGEIIELFGVGFGPTSATVLSGQPFSSVAATTSPVKLSIGSASVTPAFAGLSAAGLYQLNLVIPAGLGTGDIPLTALVGGAQSQSGITISLQ